jgi:hypothetical protein
MKADLCGTGGNGVMRRRVMPGILAAAGALAVLAITIVAVHARQHGGVPPDDDYVAIQDAPVALAAPGAGPGASAGSLTSDCGRNDNGHRNGDNVVASPGLPGAAHHAHDYVGNLSTDAYSTDQSLAAAATTCTNGDRSTFYWPVLFLRPGPSGGGMPGMGQVQSPAAVSVRYSGSPLSPVVAMPRFLRLSVGDAHAYTGGAPTPPPQWGCEGAPGRVTSRYPLCGARRVTRTFDFPSCWDGVRTDSPDHRSHVRYPTATGACPAETFPIPHLRIVVAYQLPAGARFAIDGFPDQHHSPLTDHAAFIDVMPEALMATATDCINHGRTC